MIARAVDATRHEDHRRPNPGLRKCLAIELARQPQLVALVAPPYPVGGHGVRFEHGASDADAGVRIDCEAVGRVVPAHHEIRIHLPRFLTGEQGQILGRQRLLESRPFRGERTQRHVHAEVIHGAQQATPLIGVAGGLVDGARPDERSGVHAKSKSKSYACGRCLVRR